MAVLLNQAKEKILLLRRDSSASGKIAITHFSVGTAPYYKVDPSQTQLGNRITIGGNNTKAVSVLAVYDNTATYNVGDLTIYSDTVYECITAVSVAEDFDPTKWSSMGIDATRSNIFVCTLTESECAGNSITEIGLVDYDGLLTCIKTFSAKEKTDDKQMIFYISDKWEEDDG